MSRNTMVRLLGWRALPLQGDVLFVERLGWVRRRLLRGPVRTLDAGCGTGAFTTLAARLGNDALGLTFAAADATLAADRAALVGAPSARFRVLDLRQLGPAVAELGTFDQVIACEVIEHLYDDAGLVAHLSALLRPGGRLLLTTPYLHHHPVYGEKVSETEDGGHVRFGYTHEELARLFAAAGLRVEEQGYLNGFFAQKVFSLYLRLVRVHPKLGWLLTLPLRPLRVLDPLVARASGYPYMSVTMIGVKEAATASGEGKP
jgi:SAM-dependent methyltransferase